MKHKQKQQLLEKLQRGHSSRSPSKSARNGRSSTSPSKYKNYDLNESLHELHQKVRDISFEQEKLVEHVYNSANNNTVKNKNNKNKKSIVRRNSDKCKRVRGLDDNHLQDDDQHHNNINSNEESSSNSIIVSFSNRLCFFFISVNFSQIEDG